MTPRLGAVDSLAGIMGHRLLAACDAQIVRSCGMTVLAPSRSTLSLTTVVNDRARIERRKGREYGTPMARLAYHARSI